MGWKDPRFQMFSLTSPPSLSLAVFNSPGSEEHRRTVSFDCLQGRKVLSELRLVSMSGFLGNCTVTYVPSPETALN